MFCPKCRNQVDTASNYCPVCGEPLQQGNAGSPPASPKKPNIGGIIGAILAGGILVLIGLSGVFSGLSVFF